MNVINIVKIYTSKLILHLAEFLKNTNYVRVLGDNSSRMYIFLFFFVGYNKLTIFFLFTFSLSELSIGI